MRLRCERFLMWRGTTILMGGFFTSRLVTLVTAGFDSVSLVTAGFSSPSLSLEIMIISFFAALFLSPVFTVGATGTERRPVRNGWSGRGGGGRLGSSSRSARVGITYADGAESRG